MKKIFILPILLALSMVSLGQNPCNDFNSGLDNWQGSDATLSTATTNPLDNSSYLLMTDETSPQGTSSYAFNALDFDNLGQDHLFKCLCFDFKMFDAGAGGNSPINPAIFLYNGTDYIRFTGSMSVSENSGWVTLCAPIRPSKVGSNILPSNTDGSWSVPSSVPTADQSVYYNSVLYNVTHIRIEVDNGSSDQDEAFGLDNVCIKDCYEITHQVGCLSTELNLFAQIEGAVGYSWKFPNGGTSTEQNPTVDLTVSETRLDFEGVYTCTVTFSDGSTYTLETFISIPEDCCDAEITYTVENCNIYTFSVSSADVWINCVIWSLNGEVIETTESFTRTLSPGTHEICVNYLGINSTDNSICCDEECIIVTIPEVEIVQLNLTACNYDDGEDAKVWFNPCDFCPDASSYFMVGSHNYNYNSEKGYVNPDGDIVQGCIHHALLAGEYWIYLSDENGCIFKRIDIVVTEEIGTNTTCVEDVTINCGDNINLQDLEDCESCNDELGSTWGSWYRVINGEEIEVPAIHLNVTESRTFKRYYEDPENCIRCELTINVIVEKVTPVITMVVPMPECNEDISFQDLLNILQTNNSLHCTGNYSALLVDAIDASGTGESYHLSTGGTLTMYDGFSYTIYPDDPNSCCSLIINVQCAEANSPAFDNNGSDVQVGQDIDPSENLINDAVKDINKYFLVPNPTSSVFRIATKGQLVKSNYDVVTIIDQGGRTIKSYKDLPTNYEFDLSNEASGTYYINIISNSKKVTLELILKN